MKKILLLLIVFANFAWAETPAWTQEQQMWGATAGTLLLADWATTRYATRHWNDGYYERNVFLGDRPSTDRLDLYFLVIIPVAFLIADTFPEHRTFFLQTITGLELLAVGNNLRIGWKISF